MVGGIALQLVYEVHRGYMRQHDLLASIERMLASTGNGGGRNENEINRAIGHFCAHTG